MRSILAVLVLLGVMAQSAMAQDLGCSSAVALNGPIIEVAGVSGDDTANLQCALDAAAAGGYREVFLTDPSYEIASVEVTGFTGDLRGRSIAATTVSITDNSLSCDAGIPGVALQFNVGTVSVRGMTIQVGSPCGNGLSANVIAFYSNPNDCGRRTGNGNVDRVTIVGDGVSGSDAVTAVLMDAAPQCDAITQKILGTLKVNRVELTDLDFGVISSIAGGGQADINYSDFIRVGLPISIVDAFQSTTILGNTINYNDVSGYGAGTGLGTTGIFIASTANSPSSNGTTVKSNKFFDGGSSSGGYAVLSGQYDKAVEHSMVVTGNTFNGNNANTNGAGLAVIDTSGGLVSSNTFSGVSGSWVDLASGEPADGFVGAPVEGWAIAANSFNKSTATVDISLGSGTTGNVIAKGQEFPVVADTTGSNDVLEDSTNASVFIDGGVSSSARETHRQQLETIQGVDLRALHR